MALKELVELVSRVTDLERRVSGMLRHGRVAEIDMDMLRLRLDLGPAHGGGDRFLSPWVPYAQHAGALRVHTPPEIGQQFTIVSPTGDFQQAVAVPLHWSQSVPSPSNWKDENVISFGGVRIEIRADEVVLRIGGATFLFCEQGLKVMDASIEVDGGLLDHGGIASTEGLSGPPGANPPSIRGPGGTGTDTVPAKVPGT